MRLQVMVVTSTREETVIPTSKQKKWGFWIHCWTPPLGLEMSLPLGETVYLNVHLFCDHLRDIAILKGEEVVRASRAD